MSFPNLIRDIVEIITGPGGALCMRYTYGPPKPVICPDFMLVTQVKLRSQDLGSMK